jgi:hypothetical protein
LARKKACRANSCVPLGFEKILGRWNIPFHRTRLENHGLAIKAVALQGFSAFLLVSEEKLRRAVRHFNI